MDAHDWAKWEAYYEPKLPEDHPRCEECSEALYDEEMQHSGRNDLCDDCGTVCDCCDEKAWNEDIKDGTSYHEEVKNLCVYCIENVDKGEWDREDIGPI
tara:strand:- start:228 stop:524 length:297 start_codon:yes stop_codon:yes gene_type:complete